MYHKFGIDKYPTTSVTIDQFNSHIVEFTKEKYSVKSLEYIVDTIMNDETFQRTLLGSVLMMLINLLQSWLAYV